MMKMSAKKEWMLPMDNNRKSVETVIQNLTVQIDQMRQKAAQMEGDDRDEYNRHIMDLQTQRREAEQKLAEMERSNTSTVDNIKSGIQDAWNDVKERVSDALR
jgi:outer membrane translocation and assembly module TamA